MSVSGHVSVTSAVNRYPTFLIVRMIFGSRGSGSIFFLMRLTRMSIERSKGDSARFFVIPTS